MKWGMKKPPVIGRRPRNRALLWCTAALVMLAGVAVLYCFDPARTWFYPPCMFHVLTGWNCPGCGGLRAMHKLLHGDLPGAFHSNPLVVSLIPVAVWLVARGVRQSKVGPSQANSLVPISLLWVLLGVTLVFGLLRNLPLAQFGRVSP